MLQPWSWLLQSCYGCKTQTPLPYEVPPGDIKIVAWMQRNRIFPGHLRLELATLVAEDYAKTLGITVDLEFKPRQQIEDLLLGIIKGDSVGGIFHRMAFVGIGTQDLTEMVEADDYLEAAAGFWMYDGRLMGIPAYVHWLCLAKRADLGNSSPNAGYFIYSPGFLHSALDYGNLDWVPEDICTYVEWVKQTYGLCQEPVLDLWEQGRIGMMYPVTPHLFKWIRLSEKDLDTEMLPIDNPEGTPRFYFSVPGYVVMDGK